MNARVLIVEDSDDNRQILRDLLTNAGFEVVEAIDGAAGVAMASQTHPDIIIMDVQLPVLDGYEATRRIKADPDLSGIPVIAVTSFAFTEDEKASRAAGCDGYIAKPFSPGNLLSVVRKFLQGSDRG